MGIGTFYSEDNNLIIDTDRDTQYYYDIKEDMDGMEFKNLTEVVEYFQKKHGIEYQIEDVEYLWDEDDNTFGFDKWLDDQIEMESDMYDPREYFTDSNLNGNLLNETYTGTVDNDVTVYSELRAESKLFVTDIEVGVYGDNYHSAIMATPNSNMMQELVADTQGDHSEEFLMDLIYELDDEVGKFLYEISDSTMNVTYYSYENRDIVEFIKNYEDMIEQIRNFILTNNDDFKKSPDTLIVINLLNDYSKALNTLKSKQSSTVEEDQPGLFDIIKKSEGLKILDDKNGLFDATLKLIKKDLDILENDVQSTITEYFNQLIITNPAESFRIRTSSYTSEAAYYYNREEDMKSALKGFPEEIQKTFNKNYKIYQEKWNKVALNNKK